ncbi:MAG TPA: DUF3570 domain-containing protein [Polyangiales bacterium]|nr:DUF3570 domain-containing protein [Polyangiales bacterium]
MQLRCRVRTRSAAISGRALLAAIVLLSAHARAHADNSVAAGTTVFSESGGPLHMNVIVPSANASVDLGAPVTVHVGWTADIVSGASVAVVDAPAAKVDAISSASVVDTRHDFHGGFTLRDQTASIDVNYSHAFEHDYLSNSFAATARTDLFDHDTGLSISYARAFDEVCDLAGTFDPVMKPRLDTSKGCFDSDDKMRATRDLAIHTIQAGWTQAWTPRFTSQLTLTTQVLHGFQSNPYRAVRIGKTAAQEYEPKDRARYAIGAGARYWISPLSSALALDARAYRDTWGIVSLTGELAYDQTFFSSFRVRVRGRYYNQTGATFYSDYYVLQPRGRYFTGDRELSPMQSLILGAAIIWNVPPSESGDVLGVLSGFQLTLKADELKTYFSDFHYDRAPVPNTLATIVSLEARALF